MTTEKTSDDAAHRDPNATRPTGPEERPMDWPGATAVIVVAACSLAAWTIHRFSRR